MDILSLLTLVYIPIFYILNAMSGELSLWIQSALILRLQKLVKRRGEWGSEAGEGKVKETWSSPVTVPMECIIHVFILMKNHKYYYISISLMLITFNIVLMLLSLILHSNIILSKSYINWVYLLNMKSHYVITISSIQNYYEDCKNGRWVRNWQAINSTCFLDRHH